MAGRPHPTERDLWPLLYVVPTQEAQDTAREVLRDLLAPSENSALLAACAEASQGPLARASRIMLLGRQALAARPPDTTASAQEEWRLKLESIAREIDAGFTSDELPEDLRAVREEIVSALEEAA